MGFGIAKAMLVLQFSVLLMNCFTVFGEVIETITPTTAPKHSPYHNHYPVAPPTQPPSHHHHHHHPHPHPPTVSPAHPPSHKSLPPAHSPGHHHPHHPHSPTPTPSPSPYHHSPSHPPAHSPVHPPAHPPPHIPVHPPPHIPVHPPSHTPVHPPSHTPANPPSHPPVHPPSHTPANPPSHTPVHPPAYPPKTPIPRSFVAVQGVVYCKSCKYPGVNTLLNATSVLGATVKLQCNNTKYPLVVTTKTDKNGYFFITAPKTITTYGAHKCKASLISSPVVTCNKPSDLHNGITGAVLRPQKPFMSEKLPFVLYNVGPFAFEPTCYH